MRSKDEKIKVLQDELSESRKSLDSYKELYESEKNTNKDTYEGKSKDYWTGRRRDAKSDSSESDQALLIKVRELESELKDSKNRLEIANNKYVDCQNIIDEANVTISDLRSRLVSKGADDRPLYSHYHEELNRLREQTLDQAEQIEVNIISFVCI